MTFNTTNSWPQDMNQLHAKFGVDEWMIQNPDKYDHFLEFRLTCIQEEVNEAFTAWMKNDSEEIVDAMIDICVFAIGTLDLFGVDAQKAWDTVMTANMAKERGIKPERPNPLNLPDLLKPEGWKAPSHEDNHGELPVWECLSR
jgi:predicted HAD superfamily Cof-like phosphohydrolase